MQSLSDRVAALSGPDREVDAEIMRVVKTAKFVAPCYTASLDHAMTLVPEGFDRWAVTARNSAVCARSDGVEYQVRLLDWVFAATPALALCAAALRARGL